MFIPMIKAECITWINIPYLEWVFFYFIAGFMSWGIFKTGVIESNGKIPDDDYDALKWVCILFWWFIIPFGLLQERERLVRKVGKK